MTIGARLREVREELGMSQPAFAAIAKTTKQTLFSWETGKTAPDGFQLAALSDAGADVLYILTGQHAPPPLDAAEQVLIDSYRRCKPEARVNLIQTAALLSAGLDTPSKQNVPGGTQVGNIGQRSTADGTVQVGYAGGRVRVKK